MLNNWTGTAEKGCPPQLSEWTWSW